MAKSEIVFGKLSGGGGTYCIGFKATLNRKGNSGDSSTIGPLPSDPTFAFVARPQTLTATDSVSCYTETVYLKNGSYNHIGYGNTQNPKYITYDATTKQITVSNPHSSQIVYEGFVTNSDTIVTDLEL